MLEVCSETFSRAGVLFSGEEKAHGMREFMLINDRLSTLLTTPEGKRSVVQRARNVKRRK